MAISKSIVMQNLRGAINKQIVFKQYGEKSVVAAYPDMSKVKRSIKQIANNHLMKAANSVAKSIMKNEQKRNEAQVRLNVTNNKLYTALIREYYQDNKEVFFKDVTKGTGKKSKR